MRLGRSLLAAPIHVYRWTLKPFVGQQCRHLPTCSDYALEAIKTNGCWRGLWLTVSRLARCHPWGTAGYDPVPDIQGERHGPRPWRHGRWSGRHLEAPDDDGGRGTCYRGVVTICPREAGRETIRP